MSLLTLSPHASVEEIEDEIAFTHCLLDTLDQDAEDYDVKRQEHSETLAVLHKLMASKLPPENHLAVQQAAPACTTPRKVSAAALRSGDAKEWGGACSSGADASAEGPINGFGTLSSPVALRQSRSLLSQPQDTKADLQPGPYETAFSPTFRDLPKSETISSGISSSDLRKRKSDSLAWHVNDWTGRKSARMTPSPAGTAPTSPCSTDSMEEIEKKLYRELGSVVGSTQNYRRQSTFERQREAEDRARRRRQQEIADAEMARQLQTPLQTWVPGQTASQAILNGAGGFTRMDAPKSKPKIEPARSQDFVELHGQPSHGFRNVQAQELAVPPYERAAITFPTPKTEAGLGRPYASAEASNVIDLLDSDSGEDDGLEKLNPALHNANASPRSAHDRSTSFTTKLAATKVVPTLTNVAPSDRNRAGSIQSANMPLYDGPPKPPPTSSFPPAALSWLPPGLQSGAKHLQALGSSIRSSIPPTIGAWMDDLTSVNFMMGGSTDATYSMNGSRSLANTHVTANTHATGLAYEFGGDLLDANHNGRYAVDPMAYLVHNDPAMAARSREDLNRLLENIRPDEDLPPELRGGTPLAMKYPLMEHQKLGLTWLKKMEEGSNKGGVLADDMGLGKTIQAIALMVTRKSEDPLRKTTLIIAPVALMRQWEREIKTKLKGGVHSLTVHVHHGPKKKSSFAQLREFDVVLTTFGTLASELKRKQSWDSKKQANPNMKLIPSESMALLGDECKWYRVIVDEAQCIKNKSARAAIAAYHLQALTRICMTGTPMMNNVGELYSLIHFLRIPPYNSQSKFNVDFKAPLQSNRDYARNAAMKKLQALLQAILLRRTKKSKIDGQPILNLPEKSTEITHAVFSEDQKGIYEGLERQSQVQFNRYLKAGTVLRNYSNILVLLLRLRQACCHPHLINDLGMAEGIDTDNSASDMVSLANGLKPDVVARIKAANGSFECPVCYDAVENPAIFYPCGHWSCSECLARLCDPARAIAQGNENGQDAKCPECRGKVSSKSVLDFNAFKQAHSPEAGDLGGNGPGGSGRHDEDETASETDSETESEADDETDEEGSDLGGFVVDDNETESELEGDGQPGVDDGGERENDQSESKKQKKQKRRRDRKGKGKMEKERGPQLTLAQLKKLARRNKVAKRRYLRRLQDSWVSSAKIDQIMEVLNETMNNTDEKTIVFSQFTTFLDLVEVPINREDWQYERYDGSMSSSQRNDAVCRFTEEASCRIMLVSLKAGNAGLNLVAASQVIILDPFWNPYIEEQAIDRAHRIGQLRPVKVHRILIQGTVEDRIIALQEKKRQMIETALDEGEGKSLSRLGIQQLSYLFGVSNDMGNGRN